MQSLKPMQLTYGVSVSRTLMASQNQVAQSTTLSSPIQCFNRGMNFKFKESYNTINQPNYVSMKSQNILSYVIAHIACEHYCS